MIEIYIPEEYDPSTALLKSMIVCCVIVFLKKMILDLWLVLKNAVLWCFTEEYNPIT